MPLHFPRKTPPASLKLTQPPLPEAGGLSLPTAAEPLQMPQALAALGGARCRSTEHGRAPTASAEAGEVEAEASAIASVLAEQTPSRMPPPDAFGGPRDKAAIRPLCHYQNVRYVFSTFLDADDMLGVSNPPQGGKLDYTATINANLVSPRTIAMIAPREDDPRYMVAMAAVACKQEMGLIVDLTDASDRRWGDRHYTGGGTYAASGAEATFDFEPAQGTAAGPENAVTMHMALRLRLASGQAMEQAATHLSFPVTDHCGAAPGGLHALARYISHWREAHPGESVAVHCKAGVGRTGMVLVAERLLNLHDHGKLARTNLQENIEAQTLLMRAMRSDVMVQSRAQIQSLLAFGEWLLEQPRNPEIANAAPVNFPEAAAADAPRGGSTWSRRNAIRHKAPPLAPSRTAAAGAPPSGHITPERRGTVYENVDPTGKPLPWRKPRHWPTP